VFASLEGLLVLVPTLGALESQHNLLCGLGLLVEHGLGLSSKTLLFAVITPLTLGVQGSLSSLVLGHLVGVVLAAPCAKGIAGLGNVHLKEGEEGRRR